MPSSELPRWSLPAALAVTALVVGIVLLGLAPPSPVPANAPSDRFSAARARDALAEVLGDGQPHPTGSTESARVRARLVARLRALGFEPEERTRVVCSRYGACAEVTNVLCRRAGRQSRDGVLLSAHYDSVPAGPGASDDGIGIAVLLESARALASQPPLERPVSFAFLDGEEAGLLGAEAFVVDGLGDTASVVALNVEARGTSGPSLMFETSSGNAELVKAFASAAPRPTTSSLFHAVYSRLPNDTDLTVLRRAGLAGLNFAPIGGIARYHTPLDNLDHLSLGSLQQQGDSVLHTARHLAAGAPIDGRGSDAVFVDVLSTFVLRWPLEATPWLTALAVACAVIALWLALRARLFRPGGLLRALPFVGICPALAALLSFGCFALLAALGRAPPPWPAQRGLFVVAVATVGLAPMLASLALRPRTAPFDEWAALLSGWTALAAFVGFMAPEASFLFVVPLATTAVVSIIALARPSPAGRAVAILAPIVPTFVLWLPVAWLAYDALGLQVPAVLAAVACSMALAFGPSLSLLATRSRRQLAWAATALCPVALGLGSMVPPFSRESPQRLSLAFHHDADAKTSRWLVDASSGTVPAPVIEAGGFASEIVDPAPWLGGWRPEALAGPAPDVALEAPVLEDVVRELHGSERVVRGKLRSLRGARSLTLHFPLRAAVHSVRVAGQIATLRPAGQWSTLTYLGDTGRGVELEISLGGEAAVVLSDQTPGLPEAAQPLLHARPDWCVPSQGGDQTVVSRVVRL